MPNLVEPGLANASKVEFQVFRMSCAKGRVTVQNQTKLRLFADAAGYCQRPGCRRRLFSDENGPDFK